MPLRAQYEQASPAVPTRDFRPWWGRVAVPQDRGMETELHADGDGYVLCPHRGEVSVEWCEGCPDQVSIEGDRGRVVVVCEVGPPYGPTGDEHLSPLRDVPELWR